MICKRCEQWIPENSRSNAKGYCRHCFNAIIQQNVDLDFMNG